VSRLNKTMMANRRRNFALATREKLGRDTHAPAFLPAAVAYLFR